MTVRQGFQGIGSFDQTPDQQGHINSYANTVQNTTAQNLNLGANGDNRCAFWGQVNGYNPEVSFASTTFIGAPPPVANTFCQQSISSTGGMVTSPMAPGSGVTETGAVYLP